MTLTMVTVSAHYSKLLCKHHYQDKSKTHCSSEEGHFSRFIKVHLIFIKRSQNNRRNLVSGFIYEYLLGAVHIIVTLGGFTLILVKKPGPVSSVDPA